MNSLTKGYIALSIILLSGCVTEPYTYDTLNNKRLAMREAWLDHFEQQDGYRLDEMKIPPRGYIGPSTPRSHDMRGGSVGRVSQPSTPYLVDRQTGKYLGDLSANPYHPNSVSNELGRYGSRLSPDSINNSLGKYGSAYSNSSARNPLATNPPAIIHNGGGTGSSSRWLQ